MLCEQKLHKGVKKEPFKIFKNFSNKKTFYRIHRFEVFLKSYCTYLLNSAKSVLSSSVKLGHSCTVPGCPNVLQLL